MKSFKKIAVELAIPAVALLLPVLAIAQIAPPPVSSPQSTINSVSQTQAILCTIINWIFYLLLVLAVIFVLVAAFRYLTASGDPEKVKAAGNTLLYAAIAVVVALIAKGIPFIAASFISSGTGGFTGC